MFVYLDHAQVAALDVLLRRDATAFAEFLALWLDHGCRLVISRAHLHEIGQSEDERDVERRLDVLRHFSLWSGAMDENVDWVIIREIRHQVLHRLRSGSTPAAAAYEGVREEVYRPVDHSTIEAFVRGHRPGWLEERRHRQGMAQFENRSRDLRKAYSRLANRREPKWYPDGWRMLPLVPVHPVPADADPVAAQWMREVDSRLLECWKRATRKRQMLTCIYDINNLACVQKAPEQDLSRIGFFHALAEHWVAPYCRHAGHDPAIVAATINDVDPYDAPAISLSLAVERGRKRHERRFEASDFMDVDHILWAAHSDLAFVDRRTHGFLLQARKTRDTARLLSPHIRVQIERVSTLEEVKRLIAAFTNAGAGGGEAT